ncbi:molybdopterin-dependent oxidoreductase [Pigmentiphaga aceris]|uniref:Molybdopterin-dependent oxidoreductase n=1 Tax=Pigmentiphaga aceris TaxID=1940612 RepID=A0A5C0B218_9BURK|nr:nitrate reductase [Pigmentiphaga aceris]QEI07944.1 molybdopterin-dependent oxidoreductase [Pigmentiphaga aceris]
MTVIAIHPVQPSIPHTTRTTCPYCGVGCGVRATPHPDGRVDIAGDELHPSNFGRLCVKGSALGETLDLDGRLLQPKRRDEGPGSALQAVSWDEALTATAEGFRRIIDTHGPDSVALYVSGQLLTEDYYVANKLMKGYVGSANIDTNSRLCMSSAVAGHKRAFGEDLVPVDYTDLEQTDLIVLVGSNTAWCHPILFQRMTAAREARPNMKLVVIDPRRTATCEMADMHLPVKPGTDVWLFNGLLRFLAREGLTDAKFVDQHTHGMDETLTAAAGEADSVDVARRCGIEHQALLDFYRLFAKTERVITAFSMGVNQSSAGTDKVNSIINCHLLTGRIGRAGMGPFSITGQPNAMGGREVGGLANMLASHMDLDKPAHRELVQGFWQSPSIADKPGLKAVDLFEAIEAGRVKAVWIMATNPVISMPDADQVKRALSKCELVVCSDIVENTDTSAFAHILLPALGWGEKDGTVTNSERRISRQRAFLPAPGEARADWRIISDVAKRMGYDGFDFTGPADIFDEHARLSAHANSAFVADDANPSKGIARRFDIGALTGMSPASFDAMKPVQWPLPADASHTPIRLFSDGRFSHPDGRARFVPTHPRAPVNSADEDFPLLLNSGRVRDQWHTMTRTGKTARLSEHIAESFVDMHPQDALMHGVREGGLARISTKWGAMVARVRHGGGIARGQLFVPIHWTAQFASDARVGALVNPVVDPVSGEPEFKHTPARVDEFRADWYGFVLSREHIDADKLAHWTRVPGRQFTRVEFAGRGVVEDRSAWARELLGVDAAHLDWLDYEDNTAGVYRAAHVVDGKVIACVFVSPRPDLPSRSWLASLFDKTELEETDRIGILVGQPMRKGADTGPTVCSCFGVGRNTICDAIRQRNLTTPSAVTACVKAGGNCGSCIPEIKRLIAETVVEQAA